MAGKKFTPQEVDHIADLANIPVTPAEKQTLARGFTTTIAVVDELFTLKVGEVEPTHQVTQKENVFREDEVDVTRTLTQDAALANAPRSHNGYFVVSQVREEK
jgi:aspartyl/glutamyl-tRNA(Asn/Gln) amidotransferase C subunit